MKKLSILFLAFILTHTVVGQQQATLSQYMFNPVAINPAYAGSQNALSLNLLTRFQNVGLPGAPNSQSLAIHSPLTKHQRMALGLLVVHDKISVIGQTGINGMYAYRLPTKGGTLSMGLEAGISFYRAAYTQLELYQSDVLFAQDIQQARPNFGVGLYYYTKLWYAGISMPHMVNNVFQRGADLNTIRQSTPVLVSGGYVFTLNRLMKIKPNFLFKWVDYRVVEFDLNANFLFDEVIWVGLSYKFSNALNCILEIQATDQLRLGYSYAITTGPIRKAELGSHEVLINYRLKYYSKGIVTPRYF